MKRVCLKGITRVLLLATLMVFWQAAAGSPTILVLGDSLSAGYGVATEQGWVSLLQHRLNAHGREFRVINASISGETTSGGLARLPQALRDYRPSLIIIELGANDGLRGIDSDQIRQNLTSIVKMSKQHGAEVLLCGVQIPVNYGAAFRKRYFAVYSSVSRQSDVPLVPSLLNDVAQYPALMQQDGLHPNAHGQPKILHNVWPKLSPLIARLREVQN
jgi:acyl-CoA thioesterase I